MVSGVDKARVAATLLERVAHGELEASVALDQWPQDIDRDRLLSLGWHDLSHFAVDADIRDKDPKYRTYQVSLLLNRVKQIKERYGLQ